MGGDKIVLLDGAGANGGGAATNGLLSMIPGMFANLIGGNKMDPNLVAALMNGRNNQDGFGGANGWWLWIIVLFWLWGGRGFGNGFGNGGDCCANGLPAQLNQDPPTNKERFQFTLDKDDIINMIRGVDLDPYSDVANEMEKIGLGSSSDSSYEGPTWSWFVNKVELWQKNNVWDSFSAEFLWGLYCRIKKV